MPTSLSLILCAEDGVALEDTLGLSPKTMPESEVIAPFPSTSVTLGPRASSGVMSTLEELDSTAIGRVAPQSMSSAEVPEAQVGQDVEMVDALPTLIPFRRPIRRTGDILDPLVSWSNGKVPPVPSGTFEEAMLEAHPPESNLLQSSWPVVPRLDGAIGTGWIRLQQPAVCCYRAQQRRTLPAKLDVNDFLRRALKRGIPFDFAREGMSAAEAAAPASATVLPAVLTFEDVIAQISELPIHVQAQFVRDGGIAWRLILEYGSAEAFAVALAGPSEHAVTPFFTEEAWPSNVVVERPAAWHYALLTGRTRDGSAWWPHPDIFNAFAPVEWTAGLERWFHRRKQPNVHNRNAKRAPMRDQAWYMHIQDHTSSSWRQRHRFMDARRAPALLTLGGYADEPLTLRVGAPALSTYAADGTHAEEDGPSQATEDVML
ncbi:unnamed protein product [Peniophora sp. CBMAI 1063]|nr:unnamed protein product [Peniophora sp. CBMAI 1063]